MCAKISEQASRLTDRGSGGRLCLSTNATSSWTCRNRKELEDYLLIGTNQADEQSKLGAVKK